MASRGRRLLGREALYSIREFFKASLGSEKIFLKISRASRPETFILLWILQSFLMIVGNYLVSRRIEYKYLNVPAWVTSADIWFVEDRALNLVVFKSLLVVPGLLMGSFLLRILIMDVLGRGLKGKAYLSSAITGFSATIVPECIRVIALYAVHLSKMPSKVVITLDLSGARYVRYLSSLASKVAQELYAIYMFDPWNAFVMTSIFLTWEIYLFQKIFRIIYGLGRNKALIATFILSIVTGWIDLYSSLIPWAPKYYVDPFEFRPPAGPAPGM